MKRMVTLLFVLLLLLAVAGCGSDSNSPTNDTNNQSNNSAAESKPNEKLIAQDLEKSLTDYRTENNSYAVEFYEYQIDKSLTEEKNYTAQVSVTAKSQYAYLYYTADVAYTQYDQGWSIDSCEWEMLDYEVVKYPENDTSILPEIEFANNLENQSYDCDGVFFLISGTQVTTWSPYATGTEYTTMLWEYDIENDEWDYYNTTHGSTEYVLTSKFADAWSNRISNVTATGFDVYVDNASVKTDKYHVELSKGELSSDQDAITLTFTNNDIEFFLKDMSRTQDGELQIIVTLLKTPEKVDNEHWGKFTYDMCIDYSIINKGSYGYHSYSELAHHKI